MSLFNALGIFQGTLKVRAKLTLIEGDELIGVADGEIRNAAGNLVFNRCGTIRAQRIKIEPLAPQCQSIPLPQ